MTPPANSMPQEWAQLRPEHCHSKRIDSSKLQEMHDTLRCDTQWQSTIHLPERRMMVQRILLLSQGRVKTDVTPDRAVLLAKRIELALYSRAGSLTEYSNLATLRRRLQSLVASSVHEAAACSGVVQTQSRKRRVVSRNLLLVTRDGRTAKRRRCADTSSSYSIFATIGEDCSRLVFSFLGGNEVMRHRVLNRFAASFLPSCVLSLTVEVAQLTQGLTSSSSMLQMPNLQQLMVHKAGTLMLAPSAAVVGSATTPLYAWGCAELPTTQSNDDLGAFEVACLLQSAQAPRLTRLDLRRNFIGETGLREVLTGLAQTQQQSNCSPLQVLCMGGNLVTDNCVQALQTLLEGLACPSLRFLGLEDNFLSSQGVQLILETAKVCTNASTRARRVSCDRGVNGIAMPS
ncbi:hypothetical protein BBJ29_004724 [Phytophthora kernoviae]|nr:hypothetical protein BBJ29_004724 [Phytophthora kernoviae]